MSTVVAITFGRKYMVEPHPHLSGLNADHFLLVEGETRGDAVNKAFEITKGEHAFDYLYSVDGVLDPAFQEQIQKWGYTEFVPQPETQTCSYCHGEYPFPVELHHDESECEAAQGRAS